MELVTDGFPVLILSAGDAAQETTAAVAANLSAAGARVLMTSGAAGLPFAATGHPHLDPLSMILTFYRSAERIALARGRDPDRPRLLKKVTETR